MPQTTAQKLRIKDGYSLLTINAPANFATQLLPLPKEVTVAKNAKKFNQVHWFVTNKAQLEKEVDKVIQLVKDDIVCWTYYPKGSSKIQTDLTRDKGWDVLLKHKKLQWITLISFDETWSAFSFRLKTADDNKKKAQLTLNELDDYINKEKKIIALPPELEKAFKENKNAVAFFNTLSFTNKKEYLVWIVSAKREETRHQRIAGAIERLLKGWKNPANR